MLINPQYLEDQLRLLPALGKLVGESLRKPGITEEVIRYGSHRQQVGVLFWPEREELRRRSLVMYIHGGGWNSGSPLLYRFVGHFFAGLGFPTLLGGYRLVPAVHYPAPLEDSRAALEAGLRILKGRGVRIDRVIAGGQSAGAQLAALMAYSCWPAGGLPERPFSAYFGISGPLSFVECRQPDLRKMISELMGVGDWAKADPIQRIEECGKTPALLIHGQRDPLVEVENSLAYGHALQKAGAGPVKLHLVPDGLHADLAVLFLDNSLPVTRVFIRWLTKVD